MDTHLGESVTLVIAENVRRFRAAAGWTLDEAARRTGVSKGMFFQIEKGSTNPSIGTLCKIASAFRVTLQTLLEAPARAAVKTIAVSDAVNLWGGEAQGIAKILFGLDDMSLVELWLWNIPPGASHASDPHPSGTKEMALVLKGTLSVTVDGEENTIRANRAIQFEADRPHLYANKRSAGWCEFVLVVIEPRIRDMQTQTWER